MKVWNMLSFACSILPQRHINELKKKKKSLSLKDLLVIKFECDGSDIGLIHSKCHPLPRQGRQSPSDASRRVHCPPLK